MCGVCESAAAVGRSAAELTAACIRMAGRRHQIDGALSPELHAAFALAVPVPGDMRRTVGRIKRRAAQR